MIPTQQGKVDSTLADQFETENFKLELTSKTFSVLFDTLYQDKIMSPMREICTNAFDSHTVAGKHVPFRVQLPTNLEPTFSVRDFGTGLSKTDVMGLYTTAFGTTKDGTNDQVGYLGLGSKSFFAYTDSAMVTSWYNGEQSNYICSLNAQRIPQISHVSSSPSTEPNGFKVSYSVKSQDVMAFRNAASKVLAGFRGYDIYPEFNAEVKIEAPEVVYTSDEIVVSKIAGTGYSYQYNREKKFNVRQGCVIYSVSGIDVEWLAGGHEITITVPIGTVEVAASRESLSLDEKTSLRVKEIAKAAKVKLDQEIVDKLAASTSFVQACVKFYTSVAPWRVTNNQSGMYWQGREIVRNLAVPQSIPGPILPDIAEVDAMGVPTGNVVPQVSPKIPIRLTNGAGKNAWTVQQLSVETLGKLKIATIEPDEKVLRQNVRFEDHSGCDYLIRDFTEEKKKALVAALELRDDQFIPFSTITDPGPKTMAVSKVKDANGNNKVMPYVVKHQNSWVQEELPDNDDYYWLPTDKKYGRIVVESNRYSYYNYGQPGTARPLAANGFTPIDYARGPANHFSSLRNSFPDIPWKPYVMTATMQKKADVKPENRLDVAIRKYLKDNEDEIFNLLLLRDLRNHINSSCADAVQEFGIKTRYSRQIDNSHMDFFMDAADILKRQEKLEKAVEAYQQKYSLLFGVQDLGDIQEYILFANKRKKK